MTISARQMGKTSYYMMLQVSSIIQQLAENPQAKIVVASMHEHYFKGLINFADEYGYKLKMTIPEHKAEKMFWSQVVSIERKSDGSSERRF